MRYIILVVGLVLIVAAGTYAVGFTLPEDHSVMVSRVVSARPGEVWRLITDPEGFPEWRSNVDSVEVLATDRNSPVWRETGSDGTLTLETIEFNPPNRLVARIADEDLPYGGSWTYELTSVVDGTRITITEDGEIYNPFFRTIQRYVIGFAGSANQFLDDLETWDDTR